MCAASLNMIFSFMLLATFISFNIEAKLTRRFVHSNEGSSIAAIQRFQESVVRYRAELSSANERPDFKNNPRIEECLDALNELNSKYVKVSKLFNEYQGEYSDYSRMPEQWEALQKEVDDVLGSRIKAQTALYQAQEVMPEDVQERIINVLEESSVKCIQALQEVQIGLNQEYENKMKG